MVHLKIAVFKIEIIYLDAEKTFKYFRTQNDFVGVVL